MRTPRTTSPLVLVTGASSGIGRATAIRLLRGGARVILVARRAEALAETVALAGGDCGARALLHPCDLGDRDELRALAVAVRAEHGTLDALVNNAGVGSSATFEGDDGFADAERMLELNLRAPIALTFELADLLIQARGTIVNISSVAGLVGTPDSPVYSATKWGLTGFTEALRARYDGLGVRVVCVQPGPVPTPGWSHERFAGPVSRRVFASDADSIARCVERAIAGRGGSSPVRPIMYAVIPTLRGIAPWFVRWLLAASTRNGVPTASTGRETGTPTP